MWLENWLYGAPERRRYRIDVDDVREIGKMIAEEFPDLVVTYRVLDPVTADRRAVDPAELESLSEADLQRLIVEAATPARPDGTVDRTDQYLGVELSRRQYAFLPDRIFDGEKIERLKLRVEHKISDSPERILLPVTLRWRAVRAWVVAFLGPLIILAAWVWVESTVDVPLSVHVLGWVGAAVLGVAVASPLVARARRLGPVRRVADLSGHMVIGETREKTKARRASERRDVKVRVQTALVTFAVTAAAAVVAGAILFFSLGIGADHSSTPPASTQSP